MKTFQLSEQDVKLLGMALTTEISQVAEFVKDDERAGRTNTEDMKTLVRLEDLRRRLYA